MTAGYWGRTTETAAAITGDGWLRTGDGGYVDSDGYLFLTDRIKDMIVSGGENVYPIEVEEVLAQHQDVADVTVVGTPHERWGEAPYAFVVLRDGALATEAELIAFTRAHLAHFKAPHGVTFVTELPKTATGKIQKYVLRGGRAAIATQ